MSRVELAWYELHWPRSVDYEAVVQTLRTLSASGAAPVVIESVGAHNAVVHRLGLVPVRAAAIVAQFKALIPALALVHLDGRPAVAADLAVEVGLSTSMRPLALSEAETVSRSLLAVLSGVDRAEMVIIRWQLVGSVAARSVRSNAADDSWSGDLRRALVGGSARLDADDRGSLRKKRSIAGWRAFGYVAVHAGGRSRQRQIIGQVIAAMRTAEAPGVRVQARRSSPTNAQSMSRRWRAGTQINAAELALLIAWPIGDTRSLPVIRQTSRPLPPSREITSHGRTIGRSTYPGHERLVGIRPRDALRHLHIVGPTGVGKSTLMLNLIAQDMADGRTVIVIEPKGALIADVLKRVPRGRIDDVVLIDPTDEHSVVGVNPLDRAGKSAELVADRLFGVFHHLYGGALGPRSSDILLASLITLAMTPGMSLAALPILLSDPGFRRRVVGHIDEPLVLQPFWQAFEAWSEAERTLAVAPLLNKVRPFLIRPGLRAVLGQTSTRLNMGDVFSRKKILLVNVAKGRLGSEAASLLGSVLISQIWHAAIERAGGETAEQSPAVLFVDEFQDYLNLPTDLGDALAQARGHGLAVVLAHQHLRQLSTDVRAAVLANARSRVIFQLGSDDARTLTADEPDLHVEDIRSLPAFEAYAQIVANGAAQPWFSMKTLPPSPDTGSAAIARAASSANYATPVVDIEKQLRALRGSPSDPRDLGPRRRPGGSR